MKDNDLKDWIMQNAGPALQLRIYMKQSDNQSEQIIGDLVSKLLELKEVNTALSYMDAFRTEARDNKTVEHLLHYYKDTCIDQFFPMISDLGFREGIKIFDEKMQPVAKLFTDLLAVDFGYNYLTMLHRFFFISGYTTEEIKSSMFRRLNALHIAAKERIFDIFQDGSKLPKPPQIWENRGILRDELNPFSSEATKPLPTIYDLSALAYYQYYVTDPEILAKIEDIAEYILDPEFQKTPEYYGLIWNKGRRIYHACGWCPRLPLYKENDKVLLNYLHMLSNFKSAVKSEWFNEGLNYIEQFRTEKGTYLFPKDFLSRKCLCPSATSNYIGININCHAAYLNEANMKLNRNERELLIRELVSTLNVIEIKGKMSSHSN